MSVFLETSLLLPNQTIWVAYSGGVDSHVLLHQLAQSKQRPQLRAVHVNHQLSLKASAWASHCEQVCSNLRIPLTQLCVDARAPKGKSPEEYARDLRYQAIKEIMQVGDVLVTAHHQDDQAETFLLQLLRGAGLAGLSAMAEEGIQKEIKLWRPFLHLTRTQIMEYALKNKLNWIHDESNDAINFDRNFLRHHVIPEIKQRWPSLTKLVSRSAQHCAQAQTILDEVAANDFVPGSVLHTLSKKALVSLSSARQAMVIRYWLRQEGLMPPSEKQLQEIIKTLVYGRNDAEPCVRLGDYQLRSYRDDIYLLGQEKNNNQKNEWQWHYPESLEAVGIYVPSKLVSGMITFYLPESMPLVVAFRRGGERFHPAGRVGSHPLKKLLQEWGVPPWLRDKIPLIYAGNELVAVAGYAISESVSKENKVKINFALKEAAS